MRDITIKDLAVAVVALLLLVAVVGTANATSGKKKDEPPQQEQAQVQAQGQGQSSNNDNSNRSYNTNQNANANTATASSDSTNNTTSGSSSDNQVTVIGDTYDIPSNSAFAPQPFSNMRCSAVLGAAFTNANGSGSLGIPVPRWLSRPLRDCERDADANWLAEMGMQLAAIQARCATRSMQERFGGDYKGEEATRACTTTMTQSIRDEAVLQGLRATVGALKAENSELVQEVVTLQRNQNICEEGAKRAEGALRECWAK